MNRQWEFLADGRIYAGMVTSSGFLEDGVGVQSVLDPAGPQAARISELWWLMFAICTVVFVAVLVVLLYAVLHGRARMAVAGLQAERRMTMVVGGAVAVTVVVLFVLLVASVSTGRGLSALAIPDALHLEVIGHQWWWEIHYTDAVPSQRVTTANKIHIPVGRPVVLQLTSHDVIHSFWAPNLHDKRDLIPGHVTSLALQADKPGLYRGQCAEFCGYQHAFMAFLVVAEPPDQFVAWLEHQRALAEPPTEAVRQRGQEVF
jgi:cytochrome c oxidase subunit II